MTKELFKNNLVEAIEGTYEGVEVKFHSALKVNVTSEKMSLINLPGCEKASPSLDVNALYEDYKAVDNFDLFMKKLNRTIKSAMKEYKKLEGHLDGKEPSDFFEKKDIIVQVISKERNNELLKGCPHRDFLDLAIIYRVIVTEDEGGMGSALVTNNIAKSLNLSEEELYEIAMNNTKRLFPTKYSSLREMLFSSVFGAYAALKDVEDFDELPSDDIEPEMYVLTNDKKLNGAHVFLDTNAFHIISEKLESNLWVIPSSIHEILVVPAVMDVERIHCIVQEVNSEQVAPEDFLSNNVYFFDKEKGQLSCATE